MVLHYPSKKDEKILTNERLIKKEYGNLAGKIMIRLSELRVVDCLAEISELPPPRRHKLEGKYANCWGLDLSANFRMIIQPEGNYQIEDLNTITEVKIVSIEDYH